MSLVRKIAHNTFIQVFAKMVDTCLAIIAFGMIARYLGQEGFGAFTTITSYLQFFGVIGDLGLYIIVIQMISEVGRSEQENYTNIFTLRLVTLGLVFLPALLISFALPYSQFIRIGIAILLFSTLCNSVIQLLKALFQVHFKTQIPFIAEFVGRIALIALLIAVRIWDLGLYSILIAITINNCIPIVILFWYSRRHFFHIRLAWNMAIWREALLRSWPIAISIILNLVYLRTDILILSFFQSQSDVGLYGAAYRVIDVLVSFPALFLGVSLASFSRSWSEGDLPSFRLYFQRSFEVLVILALPLIAGTYFLSTQIMYIVAGSAFAAAGPILSLLAVAAGIVYFSSLYGYLINIVGEQKNMIIGYLLGAVCGLATYLVCIPRFSYWGAIWGTLLSEVVILAAAAFFFTRKTRVIPRCAIVWKSLGATAGMSAFLFFFNSLWIAVTIPAAIILYGALLWMFGGIPSELVARIFSKRNVPTSPLA